MSDKNGIEIAIDMDLGLGSTIQEVRSPSHPIAVKIGSTSTAPPAQGFRISQASATLSQGDVALDKDFILEIVNDIADKPKAVLETYADDSRQKALMVTLVPTVSLPPAMPEIIIIADRSGSMTGSKITTLSRALKVFLRSLPEGIYFNICSFGSGHKFLWERSRSYGEKSLAEATEHVEGFDASFGGTETLAAVQASIEARDVEKDLALILCTDGDIWQQQELFSYLNTQVQNSTNPIRVFPLGIGDAVSSGLIEGVARAGNGFASTVGEHEKLDGKIVNMLKGALTEVISDYTFDVKHGPNEDDEDKDGFVLIESITKSLRITTLDEPMSGAFASDENRTAVSNNDEEGHSRYAGLPVVAVPKYLQAPQEIPPLYQSSRATVYVMISPDSPEKQPIAVVLKGTSSKGPIKYEIPVDRIAEPGKTIHQLAARKAIGELEEGRGWLVHAQNAKDNLLKDKPIFGASLEGKLKPSKFEELVEREAVRLGVKYQVGGKFCSFVAVEGGKITYQRGSSYAKTEDGLEAVGSSSYPPARSATLFSSGGGSWQPLSISRVRSIGATANFASFRGASTGTVKPASATPSSGSHGRVGGSNAGESAAVNNQDPLDQIISLQSFQGFWELEKALLDACGIKESASVTGSSRRVAATILAIIFLERKLAGEKDSWELIVEKAKGWLDSQGVKMEEEVEREPLKSFVSHL